MNATNPLSAAYGWLLLLGIGASLYFWSRIARRDSRLLLIYLAGLIGAFFGAKIIYLLAEGYLHLRDPDRWAVLATGKSILGALLGGYAGVEVGKRFVGFERTTGDLFAIVVPIGMIFGRVGCILNRCCLGQICAPAWFSVRDRSGVERWPAAQVELAFNLCALAAALVFRSRTVFPNQLFHLYLIAYGLFRFFHEFYRDTPRLVGGITGYQISAALVALLGAVGFLVRARDSRRTLVQRAGGNLDVGNHPCDAPD